MGGADGDSELKVRGSHFGGDDETVLPHDRIRLSHDGMTYDHYVDILPCSELFAIALTMTK